MELSTTARKSAQISEAFTKAFSFHKNLLDVDYSSTFCLL